MADEKLPPDGVVFRAGLHLYVLVGLLVSLFIGLGIAVAIRREDWTFLAVAGGGAVVLFLLLLVLRLEVRHEEFAYRNLSGSRTVPFTDIERAYFETVHADAAPQGVAVFWVEVRGGKRVKVNLRTFPIRAAALLFATLERHGVPIQVPDTWAAKRMNRQVREEMAKRGY
jgi:hypothetical protein